MMGKVLVRSSRLTVEKDGREEGARRKKTG